VRSNARTPYFRYRRRSLVAKEAASRPLTPTGRFIARVRAVVFGRPLASRRSASASRRSGAGDLQLGRDRSSAYATEEILRVLIVAPPPERSPLDRRVGRDRRC
jgi:hypothetical protein